MGKCKKVFQDGFFFIFGLWFEKRSAVIQKYKDIFTGFQGLFLLFLFVCLFVFLFFAFIFLFFRLGSGKCASFFFFQENIGTFSEGAKSCDNRSNQASFYDIRNF